MNIYHGNRNIVHHMLEIYFLCFLVYTDDMDFL